MAFWYLERHGLPFSIFWFGYGAVPEYMSPETYSALLNEASSVYFINLVVMYVSPPPLCFLLAATIFPSNSSLIIESTGNGSISWLSAPDASQSFNTHQPSTS